MLLVRQTYCCLIVFEGDFLTLKSLDTKFADYLVDASILKTTVPYALFKTLAFIYSQSI